MTEKKPKPRALEVEGRIDAPLEAVWNPLADRAFIAAE
jgi:uncharacterized protein YndB with AHSA1/START domain